MRKEFLSQQWRAFPPMPGGNCLSGRITQINLGKEIFLGQEKISFDSAWQLSPAKGKEIFEILRVGDLITYQNFEFCLLAPQQKEFPQSLHAPSLETLRKFSQFLSQVRFFFLQKDFLEAGTPGLVICPGTEAYLRAFSSEIHLPGRKIKLYLPTSPELHLKKMLAMNYGPLFEIKNCFRDTELSPHHEPEFLMLEWYRPFDRLTSIAKDAQDLIRLASGNPALELKSQSMKQLFSQYLKFDLTPETSREELLALAQAKGLRVSEKDSIDDIFNLIFLEKIEAQLPKETPTLVNDYPPYLAAYSRLTEEGWADRFEIYWQGLEIANAFHELNDPKIQRERMQADLQKKKELGLEILPLDENFLQALESGMPPSGGIALGLERLFMAIHGIKTIQDLKVFPYERL